MNVTIVRLSPLTKQVKRLADAQERTSACLEALCAHYGIRMSPISPEEDKGDPEVGYLTDEAAAIREAEEEAMRLGYRPPVEEP